MNAAYWIAKAEELRAWQEKHPRPPRGKYPEIDELMDELDKMAGELSNHIPGRSETMTTKDPGRPLPQAVVDRLQNVKSQAEKISRDATKQAKIEHAITVNDTAHLTYNGVLEIAKKAGLDVEQLKSRLGRVQRATLAWLRLGIAVDNLDHREAVSAVRDLFKALGSTRCVETSLGIHGDRVLSFGGVGRKARSLRITVHTDMEG